MYYSFLYQGVFGVAFLNFLVFWTDLFFSTTKKPHLLKSSKNSLISLKNSKQKSKNNFIDFHPSTSFD